MTSPTHDPIQHPVHYTFSAIEPIDAIEAWQLGFHLGCVLKYLCRAGRKGSRLEDLRKAQWYLNREISRLEQRSEHEVHKMEAGLNAGGNNSANG